MLLQPQPSHHSTRIQIFMHKMPSCIPCKMSHLSIHSFISFPLSVFPIILLATFPNQISLTKSPNQMTPSPKPNKQQPSHPCRPNPLATSFLFPCSLLPFINKSNPTQTKPYLFQKHIHMHFLPLVVYYSITHFRTGYQTEPLSWFAIISKSNQPIVNYRFTLAPFCSSPPYKSVASQSTCL